MLLVSTKSTDLTHGSFGLLSRSSDHQFFPGRMEFVSKPVRHRRFERSIGICLSLSVQSAVNFLVLASLYQLVRRRPDVHPSRGVENRNKWAEVWAELKCA